MKKSNKVKKIIVLLLVICVTLTYFIMFYNVNALYPQNKRTVYEFGDMFAAQNAEFKAIDSDFLTKDDIKNDKELTEFLEDNTDYFKSDYYSDIDLNLALIEIAVKNPTQEAMDIDLTAFHLESGAFSLQFYFPLMLYYNDFGMYINLNGGEEKVIKVPVPVSSVQFLNYNANEIKNKKYYLVYSLYPEKLMAEIKFN